MIHSDPPDPLSEDLADALGRLRRLAEGASGAETPPAGREAALPRSPGLALVAERLGLSDFECGVVLLCLCAELSTEGAQLCARLRGTPDDRRPSLRLAAALYPGAELALMGPGSALRHWLLVTPAAGGPVLDAPLELSEALMTRLCGLSEPEPALAGLLRPMAVPPLPPFQTADRILALWRGAEEEEAPLPVPVLHGESAGQRLDIARAVAAACGIGVDRLDAADLPPEPLMRERIARLIAREALLDGRLTLIEAQDPEAARCALSMAGDLGTAAIVSLPEGPAALPPGAVALAMEPSTAEGRRAIWQGAAGAGFAPGSALLRLPVDSDSAATCVARAMASGQGVADIAREMFGMPLAAVAEKVAPSQDLEALVLPEPTRAALGAMIADAAEQEAVLQDWGFGARMVRGRGLSAMFTGPSGVGKTTAAEAVALALEMDLYRIDLSRVVSKYIGETEKRLSQIFDAAERAAAVLLFDEGEALFGRRTEVRQSHDRYANQEVSFLLQRMESFDGVAILTTNQRDAVDEAFLRRLRYVVEFEAPTPEDRLAIWRAVFPPQTPLGAVDFDRLASVNLTGGHIRNIAFAAALRARAEGGPVADSHLRAALVVECRKLRKPLPPDLFDG